VAVIAVVIPYYQKKPGILRRALTSLLHQEDLPHNVRVDIVVIDDGSPVPARAEIVGLNISPPFQLRLTEQPNSGVAAARNKALGLVAGDATYIAFLDSDDTWHPRHLATAIDALNRGYDLYFCDGRRIGTADSTFHQRAAGAAFQDFLQSANAQIIGEQLYSLSKAPLFSQSLRAPGCRTPAVVYRKAAAPALVFDTTLREVGEDSLFLLQLISRSRKICCSTQELARFEDGVNIYAANSHGTIPAICCATWAFFCFITGCGKTFPSRLTTPALSLTVSGNIAGFSRF
jgi:succinoglycan biosynthesis protein ExoW